MSDAERVVAAYREWYAAAHWREVGDNPEWDELARIVRAVSDPVALLRAVEAAAGDVVARTVARIALGTGDEAETRARALLEAMRADGSLDDRPN